MEPQDYQEPWCWSENGYLADYTGNQLPLDMAYVDRIIYCVNACEKMSTESLRHGGLCRLVYTVTRARFLMMEIARLLEEDGGNKHQIAALQGMVREIEEADRRLFSGESK